MIALIRFIGLNIFFFLVMLGFVAAFGSCVPATKRLVSPVVCPSDYVKSIVSTDSYGTYDGDTVFVSKLYCVEKSGKTREIRTFRVFYTGSLLLCAPIFLLLTVGHFVGSESKK
jgi:hypothetical protein